MSTPAPIVVAVGAIVTRGEQVLLIQRGQPPGQGSWSIPGGRVELGETLEAALRREMREECNLEVKVGELAIVLNRIERGAHDDPASHYLILDFWVRPVDPASLEQPIRATSDAAAAGWFTLEELRRLPTTARLADYLDEVFRRRAIGLASCLVVAD